MNWKIIVIGVVALVALVAVAYSYKKITSLVKQGFQNVTPQNEFIMYYADWCPHCKTVLPDFKEFSSNGKVTVNGQDVILKKYEVTADPDKVKAANVKGFPTFVLTTVNGTVHEYSGPRSSAEYLKFLNEKLGGGI